MKKILKKLKPFTNEYFILLLVMLTAFAVRLYKITNPVGDWHAWRQADTISVSRIYLDYRIDLLNPRYYDISPTQTGVYNPSGLRFVEFPIYNLVNVLAFKAFPKFSLELWARLISVACAVSSVFFIFLIGKKLLNSWGGLLSAFFYALIPYNIYFTRVILPEPMTVLFLLISIWFFCKFTEKSSSANLYLSSIFLALSILLKPFVIFYFPLYVYLLVKKFGWKAFWERTDIYIALDIVLVPFFLWRAWMNNGNHGYNQIGIPASDWLLNSDGIRFKPAWWRWIFGERLGYLILGVWGVPLFVFGLLKKQNWPIILSALGMFLYVAVVATGNVRHDYYQTITIPAISLMLASGTLFLWNLKEFNIWISRPLLLFIIAMMLGMGWYQIKGDYQINHYEVIEAGKEVDKLTPKNAIVVAPYNGDTTLLYQTHRFGWPIVDRSFDELIKIGADYFVSVNYDQDTNNLLQKYKAIEKNNSFAIIDLHQPISTKK